MKVSKKKYTKHFASTLLPNNRCAISKKITFSLVSRKLISDRPTL